MVPDVKLHQLRNLVAVVKVGSIRQAARDLNVSQSAVTKSIKELEGRLGVELLHRSSHGVTPTEAGRALVARATIVEAELRHARAEIELIQGAKVGDLSISASPTVAVSLLPPAVVNFKRSRPRVNIHIEEGFYPDMLPAIRLGELDIAVCLLPEPPPDDELNFEVLLEDEVVPAARAGHPLTRASGLSLGDLGDEDWIIFGRTLSRRHIYEQTFRTNGLEPPMSTLESTSFACAMAIVENSDYIALVPKRIFAGLGRAAAIAPLSLESPMQPWTVAAITRSRNLISPACLAFLEELHRVA